MRLARERTLVLAIVASLGIAPAQDAHRDLGPDARIVFLHHSTGECIWNGGVAEWFEAHNAEHGTRYRITERAFPAADPYGWENYPFDYWNIWVRHGGESSWKTEPTLRSLTRDFDVIVFKHCFPVSNIEPDVGRPDVSSSEKRAENYRLQYLALREEMRRYPNTRFLVWTGAAQVEGDTDAGQATRARDFFEWVRTTWDEPGDSIHVWDFRSLQTEGGLYFERAYASGDAHPNEAFSRRVAPLFCRRVVEVIQGRGDGAGEPAPGAPAGVPAGEEGAGSEEASPDEPAAPSDPGPAEPARSPGAADAGAWVFDDAGDASLTLARWGAVAKRQPEGDGHVLRLQLDEGREEDWGEYGPHLALESRPLVPGQDIQGARYLAFRLKSDQQLDFTLSLTTLPDPAGERWQPHFGFSTTVDASPGPWSWVVRDLTRLDLEVEGDGAYEAAGSPGRPVQLTLLRLGIHAHYRSAVLLLDDITFFRELPEELLPFLEAR